MLEGPGVIADGCESVDQAGGDARIVRIVRRESSPVFGGAVEVLFVFRSLCQRVDIAQAVVGRRRCGDRDDV